MSISVLDIGRIQVSLLLTRLVGCSRIHRLGKKRHRGRGIRKTLGGIGNRKDESQASGFPFRARALVNVYLCLLLGPLSFFLPPVDSRLAAPWHAQGKRRRNWVYGTERVATDTHSSPSSHMEFISLVYTRYPDLFAYIQCFILRA